jgi:hypothetical protein
VVNASQQLVSASQQLVIRGFYSTGNVHHYNIISSAIAATCKGPPYQLHSHLLTTYATPLMTLARHPAALSQSQLSLHPLPNPAGPSSQSAAIALILVLRASHGRITPHYLFSPHCLLRRLPLTSYLMGSLPISADPLHFRLHCCPIAFHNLFHPCSPCLKPLLPPLCSPATPHAMPLSFPNWFNPCLLLLLLTNPSVLSTTFTSWWSKSPPSPLPNTFQQTSPSPYPLPSLPHLNQQSANQLLLLPSATSSLG